MIENTHVTDRLLIQVFILEEGSKSWSDVNTFVHRISCRDDIPSNRIRTLTEKTVKQPKKQTPDTLPSFLDTEVDIDGLGPQLSKAGFTGLSLLHSDFSVKDLMPTNGMLIELGRFQKKNKLSNDILLGWFCQLMQVTADLPSDTACSQVQEVCG